MTGMAMRRLHCIFMTVALLFLGNAGAARADATHIKASFVAESQTPAPGKPVTIALAMVPDKGWHGYWQNPGDAGVETRVSWTLPARVTASPLAYPVPQRLIVAGLMNYVFEGPYEHLITLTLPPGLARGARLPIRADIDWLACTDTICVPEKGSLALDLVVGDGGIAAADRTRFDQWRAALPKPLGSTAKFAVEKGRVRIAIPLPESVTLADPYFYPLTKDAVAYAEVQRFSRRGDILIVDTGTGPAPGGAIEGVLALGPGNGLTIRAVPGAVPSGGVPIAGAERATTDAGLTTLLLTFGAALLGGLLLNIMPCVFPILSLKALSLVRAGESERGARGEALAYAAGVILVCLALGGTLLLLRAGGEALGWAFQLQDPRVILTLLLLVTAIGFNMAGLFELPVLAAGEGLARSGGTAGAFWTGALAAFIATPCTGPFMAGALGAALVLPGIAAMAIFFGLGLGLALPFLLLGFVPALRRMLPKPGAWMGTFRRILSLPMFVTGIGLAWILGRQAGVDAMAMGLAALLLLVFGLWWTGRRQAAGKRAPWGPALVAGLAVIAIGAVLPRTAPATVAVSDEIDAERFSENRLAALRAEGKPVFLYFTADWCLTCKVNEQTAIERAEVTAAFEKAGIVTMVGDWTRGDPAIGRFLATHGRSGVPYYLFYPANDEPQELPQLLTPSMLLSLVP
jgi:DsbC/DsbD-like thiol-disulfide interchange protein/cytochrome c biogenesis protein CcdA